jgi:hypothetical protein
MEFGELSRENAKRFLNSVTPSRVISIHSELFFDGDPIYSINHQDKTLQSITKDLKKSTLEVIGLIILRVVQCAYDSVAEIQPEGNASAWPNCYLILIS